MQHFQAQGQCFSPYGPTLAGKYRAGNMFIFFPPVNWLYRLRISLFTDFGVFQRNSPKYSDDQRGNLD